MMFFNGAVRYDELRSMPLPELSNLHNEARRIKQQQENK